MSGERWQTTRTVRGRTGWPEQFNDRTLELVIALLRIVAMVGTLAALASVVAVIWTGDGRWVTTFGVSFGAGGACGFLGFWYWGNGEWRQR